MQSKITFCRYSLVYSEGNVMEKAFLNLYITRELLYWSVLFITIRFDCLVINLVWHSQSLLILFCVSLVYSERNISLKRWFMNCATIVPYVPYFLVDTAFIYSMRLTLNKTKKLMQDGWFQCKLKITLYMYRHQTRPRLFTPWFTLVASGLGQS